MNEKQITKFIKDNTMLGDCLSQKMTLYELKTLLIKYENEQLKLCEVGKSLKEFDEKDFRIWLKDYYYNIKDQLYFCKGNWYNILEMEMEYKDQSQHQL